MLFYGPGFDSRIHARGGAHYFNWLSGEKYVAQLKNVGEGAEARWFGERVLRVALTRVGGANYFFPFFCFFVVVFLPATTLLVTRRSVARRAFFREPGHFFPAPPRAISHSFYSSFFASVAL
jgi:hypothetical protein